MANEIHAFSLSGLTLYAVLFNSTGQVWNGAAFVAINPVNWTSYDIALTEATAGIYLANMPTVAAGVYDFATYERLGVNPAITDTLRGTGWLAWYGGTVAVPIITIINVTNGGMIAVRPYATWTINISNMGSLAGRTKLWLDVKDDPAIQDDNASFLRVEETAGLQRINGAAGVGVNATLVVTDPVAGNVTVTVNKSQTGLPPRAGRVWQVKLGIAGGVDTVIAEGEFNVGQTVTRTTA